jgi:hypothetical protein
VAGLVYSIVKSVESADQKNRLIIVRRDDEYFEVSAQKWCQNVFEEKLDWEGWIPLPNRVSIFQTLELAEREVKARALALFV